MSDHTIKIENGHITFVYSDELADLMDEGTTAVCRVSHVEFDNDRQGWTADMSPVDGPVLGPFTTRAEGLVAEREWLTANKGL
jgi:hypothetical protein